MTDQEFIEYWNDRKSKPRPWIDAEAIDREIAEASECEDCESPMRFRSERSHNSYRALAVCTNPECGAEVEF